MIRNFIKFCTNTLRKPKNNRPSVMPRKYYEFETLFEVHRHFQYWSDNWWKTSFPSEGLKKIYSELIQDDNSDFTKRLVEFHGNWYIGIVCNFDEITAFRSNMSMDELYTFTKRNAINLYNESIFKDTILVISKETAHVGYEIMFLVPTTKSKDSFTDIEDAISMNIWNINTD